MHVHTRTHVKRGEPGRYSHAHSLKVNEPYEGCTVAQVGKRSLNRERGWWATCRLRSDMTQACKTHLASLEWPWPLPVPSCPWWALLGQGMARQPLACTANKDSSCRAHTKTQMGGWVAHNNKSITRRTVPPLSTTCKTLCFHPSQQAQQL